MVNTSERVIANRFPWRDDPAALVIGPTGLALASDGVARAAALVPGLKLGVNIAGGSVTYAPVAEAVGVPYLPVDEALAGAAVAG